MDSLAEMLGIQKLKISKSMLENISLVAQNQNSKQIACDASLSEANLD